MKTIKLSASDLGLIVSALEIINPDSQRQENRARELAILLDSLYASKEYNLSVKGQR